MSTPPRFHVDSDAKLKKAFPKDIEPPALLFDFAAWLRGKPWGSLGTFDLSAAEKIDKLLLPEADENNNFAIFVRLPDGGLAGLWFAATRDAAVAPFVHMSSEGQFSVLAPNLALFLRRLSKGRFDPYKAEADFLVQRDEDDDDSSGPTTPDLTGALAQWLAEHPLASKVIAAASRAEREYKDDGAAQAWLMRLINDIEAAKKGDPHLKALASALTAHKLAPKASASAWQGESFRVFAAGETMVIRRGMMLIPHENVDKWLKKLKPAAEAALTAPLFAAREAHAKKRKGQGLWPSATLMILPGGTVNVDPNYDHEFAIGFDEFDAADFAADQARYPRTAKLQPWHKALIEKGKAKK